ncbi:MAG: hypothetical protein U0946_06240 [Patescibacteria group bacterium]|nr:hypothetical protein [Patescibacteria group bacterium]
MKKIHQIYLDKLLSLVEVGLIKSKRFRVLADPCNGVASELIAALLEQAGCAVVKYNWEMNKLPQRAPEPRVKSLQTTAKMVVKHDCDLGLGFDMDADRVLFIDEKGVVLSEDLAGAILGKAEIKKANDILVTPFNSSGIFKAVIEAAGGKVAESWVGPPEISAKILQTKAVFGYEESGKYFFARWFIWADGLLASLKMLEVMAKLKKSLSQIRQSYPQYYQVKLAVPCAWSKMPKRWVGKGKKEVYGDSFVFIRASGTEPLIRIFADSPLQSRTKELAEKGKRLVEEVLCAE